MLNANMLRFALILTVATLSLAASVSTHRVNPCLEEARLAAVNDSMERLKASNAADPKVYEDRSPASFSRAGNTFVYEFFLQAYDDYRGGIWPAREHYQVVVSFNRKARTPDQTCLISKTTLLEVAY